MRAWPCRHCAAVTLMGILLLLLLQKEAAAQEAVKKALGVLEGHLATRTFLVGHAVTLADIIACANLFHGFTKVGTHPGTHPPADTGLPCWAAC